MASTASDGPVPVPPEVEQAVRQWEYNEKLAFHMFQVVPQGPQGRVACFEKEPALCADARCFKRVPVLGRGSQAISLSSHDHECAHTDGAMPCA